MDVDKKRYLEDEVDLRYYMEIIIKRKKVILAVFFICVVITAIVSFLVPKIYEVSAIIRIGKIYDILVPKSEAAQMLESKELLTAVGKRFNADVSKIKIEAEDLEGSSLIRIKVRYVDPDLAVKICKALSGEFIDKGKENYGIKLTLLNGQIDDLEKKSELIDKEIIKLNQIISSQSVGSDFALLQNILANYEDTYNDLKDKIYGLRLELADSQKFEFFERPARPESPVIPNMRLNILISGVLGLMLGGFIAFFKEIWDKES